MAKYSLPPHTTYIERGYKNVVLIWYNYNSINTLSPNQTQYQPVL